MAKTYSGQITVTTAGTAIIGTSTDTYTGFFIRALSGNTGNIYIGNDGADDVASTTGFELAPGDQVYIEAPNLNELYFDAATSGDKVSWLAGAIITLRALNSW